TSKTLIPAINEVKTEIDVVKQSASRGKELVATAITGKNIATESSDTFEVMAGNIRKIKEMPAIPEDSEGIVIRKDSPSVIHKITKIE
ncbi:hypothetical protein, partial [Clostridioides difficile]|uniref:hypothetical protein n=1 Tax=Clostridioides difficile TaxID=1496 RepID=UPI001CA4BA5D